MPNVAYADSRDITLLKPEFQPKVKELISNLNKKGIYPFISSTLRGPGAQAVEYCKGRTIVSIKTEITKYRAQGLKMIPGYLEKANVSRAVSSKVTNALPGQSWHQHGEAVDFFFKTPEGKYEDNPKNPNWKILADEAKALGLFPGFYFEKFKDIPHVQFQSLPSPVMTLPALDQWLAKNFTL